MHVDPISLLFSAVSVLASVIAFLYRSKEKATSQELARFTKEVAELKAELKNERNANTAASFQRTESILTNNDKVHDELMALGRIAEAMIKSRGR